MWCYGEQWDWRSNSTHKTPFPVLDRHQRPVQGILKEKPAPPGGVYKARGGVGHLGLTHTETWGAGGGRPQSGGVWAAKTVKRPPAATSTTPVPATGHRQCTNGTRHNQHSPGTPTTALSKCGNNTSSSTGRSSRQNTATQRSMRREERLTVHGPVKNQQPDVMSYRGSEANKRFEYLKPASNFRPRRKIFLMWVRGWVGRGWPGPQTAPPPPPVLKQSGPVSRKAVRQAKTTHQAPVEPPRAC